MIIIRKLIEPIRKLIIHNKENDIEKKFGLHIPQRMRKMEFWILMADDDGTIMCAHMKLLCNPQEDLDIIP